MNDHDIVFLSELKHSYPIELSNFKYLRSTFLPEESKRGGIGVFFKKYIWPDIYNLRILNDQIWFKIRNIPNTIFGAVYIPPRDSPYFKGNAFAQIQEQIIDQENVFMLGDFNARLNNLECFNSPNENEWFYSNNPDDRQNANGTELKNICLQNDLIPINHLNFENVKCDGNLTFRKKHTWISQLDWGFCKNHSYKCIKSFKILNTFSIPSDHAALSIQMNGFKYAPALILTKAEQLGAYKTAESRIQKPNKAIKMQDINAETFINSLPDTHHIWTQNQEEDINTTCELLADILLQTANKSKINESRNSLPHLPHSTTASDRWNHILSFKNERQLWSAINWKGTVTKDAISSDKPSDLDFCNYFDTLLNPEVQPLINYTPTNLYYIPVLDDAISPIEVEASIKKLNSNKAAGIDGIPPGLLKILPDDWILLLTFILNKVFDGNYPLRWTQMKFFTIFKKGQRNDPQNYRGISIISALPKIYDKVLSERLSLWYKPREEQAGSQPNRGCEEQILTLRLLIDIAQKTRKPLYICFIDYQKAYDKVNRLKLLQYLESHGCGSKFLHAMKQSMESTGIINNEKFQTSTGVKQGGSSSCNQFTAYLDPTIDIVNSYGQDSWLNHLHLLLFMDDTVLLATSRLAMQEKLNLLKLAADQINMCFHPTKCLYITVNSPDEEPFILDNITISKTQSYNYLGSIISDTQIQTQIKDHLNSKTIHVLKFISFLTKNSDAPFYVKHKVWNSALNSAILYSCETWLTNNLRAVETLYMQTLKQLLGVRINTCNDIIHIETSIPNAKSLIVDKQLKFLNKIKQRGENHYANKVIALAMQVKSPMGKRINSLYHDHQFTFSQCEAFLEGRKQILATTNTSKRLKYKELNPAFIPFLAVTSKPIPNLTESSRLAITRLRLGSHSLRIETGRWSRTPEEQRLCQCERAIQTESHVLLECPLSEHLRSEMNLNYNNITELLNPDKEELYIIASYCRQVLNLYI